MLRMAMPPQSSDNSGGAACPEGQTVRTTKDAMGEVFASPTEQSCPNQES
jgi:hypothetical protein